MRVRRVRVGVWVAVLAGGCAVQDEDPLIGPGSATHPAVSPDGQTVAYMSNAVGLQAGAPINFEIYLAELEGGTFARLTDNEVFDADVAWKPDGSGLVYKTYAEGNDELFSVDVSGEQRVNLTNHPARDFQPHVLPGGAQVLFASDRSGSAGLYRLDLGTGETTLVYDTEHSESAPRLSPDGRHIAFVSDASGSDDIYVMDADGSNVRLLVSTPDSDWSPRWSPDGSSLVYVSGDFAEDRFDLFLVELPEVGADPRVRVLVPEVDSGNAAWTPDGSRVYFGRYVEGESRLFSVRPDGSDLRPFGTS